MTRVVTNSLEGRAAPPISQSLSRKLSVYVELAKPRIAVLELVTVVVAAYLAAPGSLSPGLLVHLVMGTAFVAASAGALNMWLERDGDAKMERTASRPFTSGRLSSRDGLLFGMVALLLGAGQLTAFVSPITAAVGLATWVIYLAIYTPLKKRTPLNTVVGAVSGALPILMGWTATGTPVDLRCWALLGVLFLWQFPHFMSIAWLSREDYARAGHRMLTVVDPSGMRAGAQAIVGALALIPVSLVIAVTPSAGSPLVYVVWALVLGTIQLAAAVHFCLQRNDTTARRLLRASLLYLPCLMGLLILVSP